MKTIEQTYKKYSQIEHVLHKSSMYLGALDVISDKQFIFINNSIQQKEINYSPALYKIIDELIVNAYDATIRDKSVDIIETTINSDSFSIYNSGSGIDIIIHKDHKVYIPQLIFGELLTSANYDENEQRITGGTFGIGSKLTNIFSKKFIVEVWDKERKLYYHQVFENNLSIINKPTITKQKDNIIGGVKITTFPDFDRFKIKEFSSDMISLLERRVIDLCGLVSKNIKIKLNNNIYITGFDDYLKLYKSDEQWIDGSCVKNPLWNFAIRFNDIKNIESGCHISFVNGINTNKNGKHVSYILDKLFDKFQKLVSPELTKKILNDYITLVLSVSIINPSFNSQTKEELMTPPSKFGFECNINDGFWNVIKNSDIISKLKQVVSLSNQKILSKLEGSKKSKVKGIPKLEDANFAGTKKSMECTLILTEGDSAKASAISGISAIKDGRNIYGVYPLRGKLLNVREASTSQLANNNEINDVKKIMGFKSNISREELRYGSILLMMDADEDGSHIKGLFINFLDYFYPQLIEHKDFLKILVTPVVKATLKDNVINFANLRAYSTWKEKTDNVEKWNIKYYKGLGTSTAKEAMEYFLNLEKNTICVVDSNTKTGNSDILLAFSKEMISQRKEWLIKYNPNNILQLEPPTTITLKQFVNQELIHFSNYDNIRSIPSVIDGFKPSQRKVIYACLKKNLNNEMKVAQLSGSVAELTAYHHGEQSLVSTIINMAQDFVGSNNVNLLQPIGQFGTRLLGGKDHSSARYIFTKLSDIVCKIIKKEDNDILKYLDDDGTMIEPETFLPVIPICLINGAEGIGTGFSTFIPNYKLEDIVEWYKCRLTNKKRKELIPFYHNFTGSIMKYDETTFVSSGIITINDNILTIDELPVKYWTSDYKEFLENLIDSRESLFKSYQNLSSDTKVKFVLKINDIESINKLNVVDENNLNNLYKYLKLYKTLKISNLTLYNTKGILHNYENVEEILEDFYHYRLEKYEERRLNLIEKYEKDKSYYNNMIRFIELVISNNKIFKMEEDKLIEYLIKNNIKKHNNSFDYVLGMSFKQLTLANMNNMIKKVKDINDIIKELNIKTKKDLWLDDLEHCK
jgi:DNA topoisomerase-2